MVGFYHTAHLQKQTESITTLYMEHKPVGWIWMFINCQPNLFICFLTWIKMSNLIRKMSHRIAVKENQIRYITNMKRIDGFRYSDWLYSFLHFLWLGQYFCHSSSEYTNLFLRIVRCSWRIIGFRVMYR